MPDQGGPADKVAPPVIPAGPVPAGAGPGHRAAPQQADRAGTAPPQRPVPPQPPARPVRGRRLRSLGAGLLIVIGVLLAPVSVLAVWADRQISDTDRFVAPLTPLAGDPNLQHAVAGQVTDAIVGAVDPAGLAGQAIGLILGDNAPPGLTDRLSGLTGPLTALVHDFVGKTVDGVVTSPELASAWEGALRAVHPQLVAVLAGESTTIVTEDGSAVLDLAPVIELAKQRLSDAGLGVAASLPPLHPTIPLFDADTLQQVQGAYRLLTTAAAALPWITALLLAGAVALATDRRRALLGVGLGLLTTTALLTAAMALARPAGLDGIPQWAVTAAEAMFDAAVGFLRDGLRGVFALGLVLTLGAFLAGDSPAARSVRRATSRLAGWLRPGGASGGPVSTWVHAHRGGLRVAVAAAAGAVLVLAGLPTGWSVLVLVVVLVLALGVIELLGRVPGGGVTGGTAAAADGGAGGGGAPATPTGARP